MRKNKTMRVAVLLLALTLITSCFVGGTFAKYVTKVEGTDKARVAYWGFDQTTWTEFDLFDGEYTNVKSNDSGTTNVIAPGTSKEETVSFAYDSTAGSTPEVAYTFEIKFEATGNYSALDTNENFVWELTMPGKSKQTYQTVAKLEEAIEALNKTEASTGEKFYGPNTLPDGFTAGNANNITIGWNWTFSKNETGDTADTTMGNADSLDNVEFKVAIEAIQVD